MNHAFLQVAVGGALGSMARYGVNIMAARISAGFPLGTLTVNIVGCFVMGILAAAIAGRGGQHYAPLLLTGVLGGFTTFSAFALDTMVLWERGAVLTAAGYVLASVVISLLAVFAGLAMGRGLFV
ncbi:MULTISPECIES: fluoride efflux transporter CrcB [Paracoccus]|jgi:CrcB protein|uniref:Fluoride-specific ion channel FluC n=1 Tax=Paracoccus litorisediminis TaxID=2006130 RepID=A0A844HGE6_9RHOB|nr:MULTISPECIES: fluoride efflux transporter CrcB [Paracoccus]MBD9526383.1 fluoride efflux transporter CrcB [Paracoccus sp. PAR01]MTH58786.1 fluoride efflux transporter CrcB [Paracoccus litorisediminis]